MTANATAGLRAIKRQPAEQLTANELRRVIITGELPASSRITEASLAQQFDVSRGTLRTALHQLSQEGLIVQTPYTGWTVMSIQLQDLEELYTLRAALESLAGRLASEKLTPEGAAALEDAFEQLQLARHRGEPNSVIVNRDFRIHQTIIELAKHKRLRDHYRMVEQQIRLFIAATHVDTENPNTTLEHHSAIVEAIVRKDAQDASRLLEEHSISEGQRLFKNLSIALSQEGSKS